MKDIVVYIKYIIRFFIRNMAKILFIFPIKNNRILFTSRMGEGIDDNPKYIFDFLRNKYPYQFEYVWIYNGGKDSVNIGEGINLIKRHSLKWFYYFETSRVIVDNYEPSALIPKRKGQFYIETWHAGGAYKKIGGESSELKAESKNAYRSMNTYIDLFISSSKVFTKYNIRSGYHYHGGILNCGMPRNDVFFNNSVVEKFSEKVRNYYSLKGKIVLYAPTFRGELTHSSELNVVFDADMLRMVLENEYDSNVNILVRCHPWDKHKYDFEGNVIDVGEYPDMQELLCATDILITDYSSSMWDFALLGRPCLLYTPDIDMYIQERGFFTSPQHWPGIICKNMNDLCKKITDLDQKACEERDYKYLERMGSYENGHATEIISNRIIDYIKGA